MGMFEKLKQLLKKKETRQVSVKASSKEKGSPVPASAPRPAGSEAPPAAPPEEPRPQATQKAKKAVPKKGKHGLTVLSADEDLEALFREEGPREVPPPPRPKPKPRVARPAPPPPKKTKKRNRHGILVLEEETDLLGLMAEEAEREGDRVVPSALRPVEAQPLAPVKKVQRDRHGLPILEQGQLPAFEGSDEFASLLASSLSEKSGEVLLSEKVDKLERARALPLKDRLKRYPAPQGQLDLHGYTAAKADQTAEHYVRRAFSVGTYTLRLIVGKGLHSEHGAVLPDTIADRMTVLKQEGIVLAWAWEKGKKAKSGSILVYLNNYDSSRHRR